MKKNVLYAMFCVFLLAEMKAQAPKLHLNFVSHNEPDDTLQNYHGFTKSAYWTRQIATLIQSKGAKLNFQTCDGFLDGAISFESAVTSSSDVIQVLDTMANVEVDPRYKSYKPSFAARNYADNAYLISQCGASPTHILGGFLWASTSGNPDWFPYQNSVNSSAYPGHPWQADILYGPGSFPPHDNDLNDFGCWKPDTTNNFYSHNSNRHLWMMGNGCAPLLDSLDDEQTVIDLIQGHVDSIQSGFWPSSKFYTATIMINQSNFGPTLYNKLSTLIDSINITCGNNVEWELITEKFISFQAWQSNPDDYSQWMCGEVGTGSAEHVLQNTFEFSLFPNPAQDALTLNLKQAESSSVCTIYDAKGAVVHTEKITGAVSSLNIASIEAGLYFVKIDSGKSFAIKKFTKN